MIIDSKCKYLVWQEINRHFQMTHVFVVVVFVASNRQHHDLKTWMKIPWILR